MADEMIAAERKNRTTHSGTGQPVSIRQEACISVRSTFGACRLCLDACPDECLKFEKGVIVFDADDCIRCGICTSICPSSAFKLHRHEESVIYNAIEEALESSDEIRIGCRLSTIPEKDRKKTIPLPCLSMANETILVDAVLEGAKKILLKAPCDHHSLKTGETIIKRSVEQALLILSALGKEATIIFDSAATTPVETAEAVPIGEHYSRREFMNGISEAFAREMLSAGNETAAPGIQAGRLKPIPLPRRRRRLNDQVKPLESSDYEFAETDSPLRVIDINENCSTCMACSAYCPTGALSREEGPDAILITFAANRCVKCHGCAELCPEDAISYMEKFTASDALSSAVVKYGKNQTICISCERPFMPKGKEKQCRACTKLEKFQKSLLGSYRREHS